jgi:hypothetical protein
MRRVTILSPHDLAGSIRIPQALFHRLVTDDSDRLGALRALIRAGGLKPLQTLELAIPDAAAPDACLARLKEITRTPRDRIILDHATGRLWHERPTDSDHGPDRVMEAMGAIQDAFLSDETVDLATFGTLAVTMTTRRTDLLALALSRAIASMSHAEAQRALAKSSVIMRLPMLVDLILDVLRTCADRHAAVNAGESVDEEGIRADDILTRLDVAPLHVRAA